MVIKDEHNGQFYLVLGEKKRKYVRHPSIDAAIHEGKRLAAKMGREFVICEVKGTVYPPTAKTEEK